MLSNVSPHQSDVAIGFVDSKSPLIAYVNVSDLLAAKTWLVMPPAEIANIDNVVATSICFFILIIYLPLVLVD